MFIFSTATKEPINNVNFLGMKLSAKDAETGLNATFVLLIIALTGAICLFIGFFLVKKSSKKSKKTENVELDKRS